MAKPATKMNARKASALSTRSAPAALSMTEWPIERVKPYDKNAKKHPAKQIELLAKLLQEHKFDVPIVVDGQGVIIKGHGRLLAAKHLGLKTVPVIVRDDLTPAQVVAARIADNKVAELGAWDLETLIDDIKVGMELPDFDLEALGLNMSFVDQHFRIADGENSGKEKQTLQNEELRYSVIVDFDNENDQAAFLEAVETEGHTCRLLIS